MNAIAALAAALASGALALGPRSRPLAFEAQMSRLQNPAVPAAWEYAAALKASDDSRRQLAALDEIALRAAALSEADQIRLVEALEAAANSPANSAAVRRRSVDSLGRAALSFRDRPAAVQKSVAVLTELAHREGPEFSSIRRTALLALSGLSDHLGWTDDRATWIDPRTDELIFLTALDGLRGASGPQEATWAVMILHNMIECRGSGIVYRPSAAGRASVFNLFRQRVEAQLFEPLSSPAGLDAFYVDARYGADYRHFLMRSLHLLDQGQAKTDPALSGRIRGILAAMADREPDARLKEIARLYSIGVGA